MGRWVFIWITINWIIITVICFLIVTRTKSIMKVSMSDRMEIFLLIDKFFINALVSIKCFWVSENLVSYLKRRGNYGVIWQSVLSFSFFLRQNSNCKAKSVQKLLFSSTSRLISGGCIAIQSTKNFSKSFDWYSDFIEMSWICIAVKLHLFKRINTFQNVSFFQIEIKKLVKSFVS